MSLEDIMITQSDPRFNPRAKTCETPSDPIVVPVTQALLDEALAEVAARSPHMRQRVNDASPLFLHRERAASFTVEFSIRRHIQALLPGCYCEPANWGVPERGCSHDFRLALPSGVVEIDVASPNHAGLYTGHHHDGTKGATDWHLLARLSRDLRIVLWEGAVRGADFRGRVRLDSPAVLTPSQWLSLIDPRGPQALAMRGAA
jgi:hypothetical protein